MSRHKDANFDEEIRRSISEEEIPIEAYEKTHQEIEEMMQLSEFAHVPPSHHYFRVQEFKLQQAEEWGVPTYDHLLYEREILIEEWEMEHEDDPGFCSYDEHCLCERCRYCTDLDEVDSSAAQLEDYYWSKRFNDIERFEQTKEQIFMNDDAMDRFYEEGLESASEWWKERWIEMMRHELHYQQEEQELREEALVTGIQWLSRPATGSLVLAPYGPGHALPPGNGTHMSAKFPLPPLLFEGAEGIFRCHPQEQSHASAWAEFMHTPFIDLDVHLRFARPPAALQWWVFLLYMAPDEDVVLFEMLGTSGWGKTFLKPLAVGEYESDTDGVKPLRVYLPFNPVNCQGVPRRSVRNPMTYNTEAKVVMVWCAPPYLDKRIDTRYNLRRMMRNTPHHERSYPVEEWMTYVEADPVEDVFNIDPIKYFEAHSPWMTDRHRDAVLRINNVVSDTSQLDFGDWMITQRERRYSVSAAREHGFISEDDYLTALDLFGKMVNEEMFCPPTQNSRHPDSREFWEGRTKERSARTWAQYITGASIFGVRWTPEWLFHNGPADARCIESLLDLVDIAPTEKSPEGGIVLSDIEATIKDKPWFGMEIYDLSMLELLRKMRPWFESSDKDSLNLQNLMAAPRW